MKLHLNKHWLKWTSKSLLAYFDIYENCLSQNLAQYNRIKKKITNTNTRKSSLDLWRKITRGHVTSVQDYLNNNQNAKVTVNQIKKFLELDKSLKKFSSFSIRKILKNILDFRYKTLHETHPKTFMDGNIRQFYESAYLQLKLEADGFEVIYIDEFSFKHESKNTKDGLERENMDFWKRLSMIFQ